MQAEQLIIKVKDNEYKVKKSGYITASYKGNLFEIHIESAVKALIDHQQEYFTESGLTYAFPLSP